MKSLVVVCLLISSTCVAADIAVPPQALPAIALDAQGRRFFLPPCECPPQVAKKEKKKKKSKGRKRVVRLGQSAAASAPALDPFDRHQVGGRARARTEANPWASEEAAATLCVVPSPATVSADLGVPSVALPVCPRQRLLMQVAVQRDEFVYDDELTALMEEVEIADCPGDLGPTPSCVLR